MSKESNKMYTCWCCHRVFHEDYVRNECAVYEGAYTCPICSNVLNNKPEVKPITSYSEFLPDEDQVRYLRHIVEKQLHKVEHAQKQLYSILGKLEIMSEMAKEKESK